MNHIERCNNIQQKDTKGAFTLAQFRGRFCTKLAHLLMKKNIFLAKCASLMRNRMQNSLM